MAGLFGILQQLILAWQDKDIDRVVAFLHEDIVWHYAAGPMPPVRGKAKAAKLLHGLQGDMHAVQWRIFHYAEAGERLFVEGVDDYTTADGRRVAAPYAGVLEFKDGKIIGWRDYVDLSVIESHKRGEPLSAHVDALIDRPRAA
jgi:limonene-1,2-epoxide hydrolase